MKVTGEIAPIPATPAPISEAERKLIQEVDGFWFGAEE